MKRIITFILLALIMCQVYARNFFSERFFEFQTIVPVNISNNTLPFSDYLQKELVIDLRQIANNVSDDGFIISLDANPTVGFNLRVANLFIGFSTGVEAYERLVISKDLFDFIGKGNEIGDEINIALQNNTDVYYDVNFDVGFKLGRFGVHVKPTFFVPLVVATGSAANVKYLNDEEGNINIEVASDIEIYSAVNLDHPKDDINSGLTKGMGFDLAGSVTMPFLTSSSLEFDARIPLVPGKLTHKMNYHMVRQYDLNILDLDNKESVETEEKEYIDDVDYYINRPLKFDAYIIHPMFAKLITLRGGLGIGFYHPFVEDTEWYPEYYGGATLNLANILKTGLSMEYTDRIYKNQFFISANARIIQIDMGISLQSANFISSFTGKGYGAFVGISAGF